MPAPGLVVLYRRIDLLREHSPVASRIWIDQGHFCCCGGRAHLFFCYGGRARSFFAMEAGRLFFCCGGRARCEDVPRESAVLGEIALTLHTRNATTLQHFRTKIQGRSTPQRHFARKYEDAPHQSAILRKNKTTLRERTQFSVKMRGRFTPERDSA